jgi:hypothetical protein
MKKKRRVPFKNYLLVDAMLISLRMIIRPPGSCLPLRFELLALSFIHVLCYVYGLFRESSMLPFESLQRIGHCERRRGDYC